VSEFAVDLDDILAARDRIADGVERTSCGHSPWLSPLCGAELYLKREHRQRTGSFKERGARNALMMLADRQRRSGVIAASAGNHALALAYHGKQLGIPVTVVMPTFAPLIKVAQCRRFDAEVILHGSDIGESKERAMAVGTQRQLTYINGYDHPHVIAGAGTIALEMLEQIPELDALVVPIGGAGLIAGVSLAAKSVKPAIRVLGVQARAAPGFGVSLEAGRPTAVAVRPTLADGLAVPLVGANAFEIARHLVDDVVSVDESDIAIAILRLVEMEKAVVEGAGAVGVAALISGRLDRLRGQRIGTILCGGNIDTPMLGRIINRGLAADGRICQFRAHISDRPGGLAAFARTLADEGVNVLEISHDRVFGGDEISSVSVECRVETRDREHSETLQQRLHEAGFETRFHALPHARP
jgi:threonine dehydratase